MNAIFALATMQTGLHGDPRTTNPAPGAPPYPPFLGVSDWPLFSSVTSVLVTVGFFGVVLRCSIRDRRPHWALLVGIAALLAGALDPLANWATFAVFDPRVGHFPLSWPYFYASPLLEPTAERLDEAVVALASLGSGGCLRRLGQRRRDGEPVCGLVFAHSFGLSRVRHSRQASPRSWFLAMPLLLARQLGSRVSLWRGPGTSVAFRGQPSQ